MASEADIETLMAFVGSINREQSQALLSVRSDATTIFGLSTDDLGVEK